MLCGTSLLFQWRAGTGGDPGAVVKDVCLEHRKTRVRTPLWPWSFKEIKMFLPSIFVKIQYCGEPPWPRGRCSASGRQGSNFESCVCRAVSSHSSHHPQEFLLAQFSLYVHKCGLKPNSFHLISMDFHFDEYNYNYNFFCIIFIVIKVIVWLCWLPWSSSRILT